MISWQCPHCGKKMHSAWDDRENELIVCIHCAGTFVNPFYREEKDKPKSLRDEILEGEEIKKICGLWADKAEEISDKLDVVISDVDNDLLSRDQVVERLIKISEMLY